LEQLLKTEVTLAKMTIPNAIDSAFHACNAHVKRWQIIWSPDGIGKLLTIFRQTTYSLCFKINVILVFKFCPTKNVILVYNEIHLIKAISSIKEILYRKTYRGNQILNICYFSSSNAYAFIEGLES
jgi:hypothetical protein